MQELQDDYLSICQELGLLPSDAVSSTDTVAPVRVHVDDIEGLSDDFSGPLTLFGLPAGGEVSTWLSPETACVRCLLLGIDAHIASGDWRVFAPLPAWYPNLVDKFWNHHDVSLAVTNASETQNWSLVLPKPVCVRCWSRRAHLSRTAIRVALGESDPAELSPERDITSPDSGGFRSATPDAFLGQVRGAIGFASILQNPREVRAPGAAVFLMESCLAGISPAGYEAAGGKGSTYNQALASCVGEGIERYLLSGMWSESTPGPKTTDAQPRRLDLGQLGFPASNLDGAEIPWDGEEANIEWVTTRRLDGRVSVQVPSNLVFAPYQPAAGKKAILPSGTNGAAAGATFEDAATQAALELIERDALWFHLRSNTAPLAVSEQNIPETCLADSQFYAGTFRFQFLKNPFKLPVVQVLYEAPITVRPRYSRGTGVSTSLSAAVQRAYNECIQMLVSLETGLDIDESHTDMRSYWHSGEAEHQFPAIFTPPEATTDSTCYEEFSSRGELLSHISIECKRQDLEFYFAELYSSPTISVVKAVSTGIPPIDSTYFQGGRYGQRLRSFGKIINKPFTPGPHRGNLFM